MKRPEASPWSLALHQLAQARESSWTRGAATGVAWDAVHAGEEQLLAAAPCPAAVGEKLHYLLAVSQPPGTAALRRREQPWQQPWRHRLLRSAIDDVARLGAMLAAAQAEAQRLHKGDGRLSRTAAGTAHLRKQLAVCRTELKEVAAERDAALKQLAVCRTELEEVAAERDAALKALARANQPHVLAVLGISHAGPIMQ